MASLDKEPSAPPAVADVYPDLQSVVAGEENGISAGFSDPGGAQIVDPEGFPGTPSAPEIEGSEQVQANIRGSAPRSGPPSGDGLPAGVEIQPFTEQQLFGLLLVQGGGSGRFSGPVPEHLSFVEDFLANAEATSTVCHPLRSLLNRYLKARQGLASAEKVVQDRKVEAEDLFRNSVWNFLPKSCENQGWCQDGIKVTSKHGYKVISSR